MIRCAGVVLPVVVLFVSACSATVPSPTLTHQSGPPTREGYVNAAGGVRLFYRLVGAGSDTVVVLHGGPGFSMGYLAPDLEPLAARHTLLFYDQRGAGRSTLVTDSAALDAQRFADDLEAVRRELGLARLTLLGHSWGAGVAALYAARHPERVGRLLIVGAIPATRNHLTQAFQNLNARRDSAAQRRLLELRTAWRANPGDAAACRAYYEVWFTPSFADSTALRRSRGDFCAGPPEALVNKGRNVDRFTMPSLGEWDWRSGLRAVTAPTLVIHGAQDFMSFESAREWATTLPNARLLVLDQSGHFPYLDVPERFFAAVEEFLQGRWPVGAQAPSGMQPDEE